MQEGQIHRPITCSRLLLNQEYFAFSRKVGFKNLSVAEVRNAWLETEGQTRYENHSFLMLQSAIASHPNVCTLEKS